MSPDVDLGRRTDADVLGAASSGFDPAEFEGSIDLLFLTLDTLRFDVAQQLWQEKQLVHLGPYLGDTGWECRHSPASFTYAAHQAFFAGFLPTPQSPGLHPRLFASRFGGSETTGDRTFVFDEATLPEALFKRGYHTICIGGTGFFNPSTALGRVLPNLFTEWHWSPSLGVASRRSEVHQVRQAVECVEATRDAPLFLFMNIAAIHQPNWFYGSDAAIDTLDTHGAALLAVDCALPPLFDSLRARKRRTFCIVCSDHGTAYGEGGHHGHRLAHEVVWNVPYAEFWL